MKRLLLASSLTALLAAGPLAAQTPPAPAPQPPAATPGMPGPGTGTPGPTFPPIETTRPGTPADPTAPRPPLASGTDRTTSDRLPPIDLERRR